MFSIRYFGASASFTPVFSVPWLMSNSELPFCRNDGADQSFAWLLEPAGFETPWMSR